MREKLMYAAAAGLILLAVAFVLRGPDKAPESSDSSLADHSGNRIRSNTRNEAESGSSSPILSSGDASASAENPQTQAASGAPSDTPQSRMPAPGSRQGKASSSATPAATASTAAGKPSDGPAETPEEAPVENIPLPAVRLAPDVQLPAVILAIHKEQNDPNNQKPQPIKDAMNAIVDRFYEDLAKAAAAGEHASIDDDGTHVIGKGPAVDRARNYANEVYRALFGNAAFNQMTMDAVLEAQLPPTE
jgi:hypothetical protein